MVVLIHNACDEEKQHPISFIWKITPMLVMHDEVLSVLVGEIDYWEQDDVTIKEIERSFEQDYDLMVQHQ
jgi:hypothetical protein